MREMSGLPAFPSDFIIVFNDGKPDSRSLCQLFMLKLMLYSVFHTYRRQYRMEEVKQVKQRILSGIQPTGVFTLGNYMGAITNWEQM